MLTLTKHIPAGWVPYVAVTRIDRPVGTLLLLWPTLAALWLAAEGTPSLLNVIVFTLGTFLMRSAGCVINDIADRNFDGSVERTRERPLVTGALSLRNAAILLAVLLLLAASLLLFLNPLARWLALAAVAIAGTYPFMKRWTYLPQVVLGAAFGWGIVMAFAAESGRVGSEGWLLFVASLTWIVAYDTFYAMVDRDDDLRAGIKSTAILFGAQDRFMIGLLQGATLCGLALLGQRLGFGASYWLALAIMAVLFLYQQHITRKRERDACFRAFLNNTWVGFALFAGVVTELSLLPLLSAPQP